MLRAIYYLESELNKLFASDLPKYQEEAQEYLRKIDDFQKALEVLKEAEGYEE